MNVYSSTILFFIVLGTARAFFVTTPKCGFAFYTRTGTFSSPAYRAPNGSTNNYEECEWRITGGIDEKIILHITDIDITKTPNCTEGFVEVRDGYWYDSPLLGRVCGQGSLDAIRATTNTMYILYKYNHPNGHKGFIANYESVCGEDIFVDNTTQISTPNYPQNYPLNKKCIWRIIVPDYHLVVFTFNSFDVEYQSDCLYDSVRIRDGLTDDSNLIGVFCNAGSRRAPPPIQIMSNSTSLYVDFVSDISVRGGGFSATIQVDYDECQTELNDCAQICINTVESYRCACRPGFELHSNGRDCEVACGGTLNSTNGSIHSPFYPDVYPVNQTCTWDIVVEPHNLIKINFSHFDIEGSSGNDTDQCDNDKLEIFNRNATNSALLGSYCGEEAPEPITSESNALRLVFQSDLSVQGTGFLLDYHSEFDFCAINNGNCLHGCNRSAQEAICECSSGYTHQNSNRDCGKSNCWFELGSPSGNVRSPNYPSNYANSQSCSWSFKITPGHRLRVAFSAFQLENQATCNYDKVTFYDGLTTNNTQLGKFCGTSIPSPITSLTNELYMTFNSDGSNVFSGFNATYSSLCGGQLQATDQNRYIYSHVDYGYSNYTNGLNCSWSIQATDGNFVSLFFSNFHLEADCQKDYVEVLDGSNSLGKFCGSAIHQNIRSTSRSVEIRFVTDSVINDKGFALQYQAVRNGTSEINVRSY